MFFNEGIEPKEKGTKLDDIKLKIAKWTLYILLIWFIYKVPGDIELARQRIDPNDYTSLIYTLDSLPPGKVIWISPVGPENVDKPNKYDFYQIAIYNFATNKVYRLTVPVFIALYLKEVGYVLPRNGPENFQ